MNYLDSLTITQKILLASKIKGIGRVFLNTLMKDRAFYSLSPNEWHTYSSEFNSFKSGSTAFKLATQLYDRDIDLSKKYSHSIISPFDKVYPKWLNSLAVKPPILFVAGDPMYFSEKSITVIGTREPSKHGVITCQRVTTYFVNTGWQIVSGLANGIDTVAHETTVSLKGSTVAVLAHGLDTIAPKSNTNLAKEIVKNNGLLVTEYPYETPAFSSNFVERDKLQAELASSVFMIQSASVGGSLHASRAIINLDRKLFVPYPTNHDLSIKYPKIEANLIFAGNDSTRSAEILKSSPEKIRRSLNIFYSKEQYPMIESSLLEDIKALNDQINKKVRQ